MKPSTPFVLHYDPPRPYARATRVGSLVFLAGETGTDGHTGRIVEGGILEQAERAFRNLGESLDAFSLGWADLVRMDVFLTDSAHIDPFMSVLRTRMPDGSPPGALVCVKELAHEGMLVEIECIAAIPDSDRE